MQFAIDDFNALKSRIVVSLLFQFTQTVNESCFLILHPLTRRGVTSGPEETADLVSYIFAGLCSSTPKKTQSFQKPHRRTIHSSNFARPPSISYTWQSAILPTSSILATATRAPCHLSKAVPNRKSQDHIRSCLCPTRQLQRSLATLDTILPTRFSILSSFLPAVGAPSKWLQQG